MATAIFAVVAVGFTATLAASLRTYVVSRAHTVAEQLATRQLEQARSLPYDQVGTVGGNPPGSLAASSITRVAGVAYTVATRVTYRDDPRPGGYQTYANYKLVEVTVTGSLSTRPLASLDTVVAPPTQPSLSAGVVKTLVADYALNTPVVGALVQLGTGPDAPRSDLTDAAGNVVFAALTPTPPTGPQAAYDVLVSAPSYTVLRDDLAPAPAAHTSLAPGQVFSTVLRVYRAATISVSLLDSAGQPYTGAATVTIASSRGAESFATSTGSLTVTRVAGEAVVPSLQYTVGARATGAFAPSVSKVVPDNYPTVLTSTFTLTMAPATTARLNVHVRDASTHSPVAGAHVVITDGPLGVVVDGTADPGGVLVVDLPAGSSPLYTVTVPAQGTHQANHVTTADPGPGTTVITVDVAPSP